MDRLPIPIKLLGEGSRGIVDLGQWQSRLDSQGIKYDSCDIRRR
jgi:hypothetical protein